jgi:hypothetical protein
MTVTAIADGLLRVGHGAMSSKSSYQVGSVDLALGGGLRGVVPPQGSRSSYPVQRVDPAVGGGRRGVVPPQEKR